MKLHNNRELAVVTTAAPVNGRGITGSLGNFRIWGGVWEEDSDGEGGEGVDVDVLGGDAVSGGEGGVSGGDNVVRAGGDAEGVDGIGVEERGLD